MSPDKLSAHLRVFGLVLAFSLRSAAQPTTTAPPASSIDFIIGVALSLIGSLFSNFGVNIQKYSQMKDSEKHPDKQTAYYKQPRWVMGFLLVVLGSVGDFSALKFAAQSIVAPLAAVSLISNVFFAHFWLGETLSGRDIGGTALVVLGCIVSVAFGDHSEQEYTLDDLLALFEKSLFIVYAIVIVGMGALIYILLKVRMEPLHAALLDALSPHSPRAASPSQPTRNKTLGDAAPDHVGAIDRYQITPELAHQAPGRRMSLMMGITRSQQTRRETKEHVSHLKGSYKKWETLHPIAYCALSGLLGGQSLLFAKSTVLMLNATFAGDNQFVVWQTYIFIFSLLFCIVSQLHFLAMALKYFDVMFVVPVFQTWFIGISTLGGIFYFREFEAFKPLQFFLFPFGLLLTLLGVFILSSSRPPSFDLPEAEEDEGRASRPSFTPTVVVVEEGDEGDDIASLPTRAPRVQKRRPTVFGSFAPAAMATNAGVRPGLGNLAEWEKRVANRFPQRKMKKRHSLPAQRGGIVLVSAPPTTESITEETDEEAAVAGRDRLSTIRESIGARERDPSSASIWDDVPGRESRAMTYA